MPPRPHRRTRSRAALAVAVAATGVLAPTLSATAAPAPKPPKRTFAPTSPALTEVRSAAAEHGVPTAVLAAYVDAQTGWRNHGSSMSTSGGYGPAHLVDASTLPVGLRDGGGPTDRSGIAARDRRDTLGKAARLTGASRAALKADAATNLRGAAAVLADAQRRLHQRLGSTTDPASWYGAVAATAPTNADGVELADATMASLRGGGTRVTAWGPLRLAAVVVGPAATAQRTTVLRATPSKRPLNALTGQDCPSSLACDWLPAQYAPTGPGLGDYGNHDLANRNVTGPRIDTIVIHDIEGPYGNEVVSVQDPAYLGWNYTIRSSDGKVAQHLAAKDVGWHAGNWYMNMHSIGIEHEGFAAKGGLWYTEAMYRSSARLVGYLARKYGVPMDRGHIIGHEQVPGGQASTIRGMHWDPGPYWDWKHYFDLLGAPLTNGTRPLGTSVQVGQAVRVLPTFSTNVQPLRGCRRGGVLCPAQGSNVVPVRQSPSATAPLVNDIGLWPSGAASSWDISDWGGRAAVGTDYVVAAVRGEWVGIWFAGRLGWVRNSAAKPTLRVLNRATVVKPAGKVAPTYGRAYPEASAYPAGDEPEKIDALPYTIPAGQAYVVTDANPQTDYYKSRTFDPRTPGDHVDIVGKDKYLTIDLGHRLGYVRAADVRVTSAR